MIVTKLSLVVLLTGFVIFFSTQTMVDAMAGRCYLCSQNTLAECVGTIEQDSSLYATVLQYYTEPCNGQCVLFRNENSSTIRGCSWTYGHMTAKSTGWHELSPGIQAYFCDTHLCNNGTYEQPEVVSVRTAMVKNDYSFLLPTTVDDQQLFIMEGHTPTIINMESPIPSINSITRQLRQCYSCTARSTGCGEFLDPRFVSQYIRPCPSSCIIFRNPADHNLITRDCSTSWPQVRAKSGLHKLLGSDAFFCQESLCNGISFDFIMGIFHNQLPAVITFPPTPTGEEMISTSIVTTLPTTTATTVALSRTTAIIDDETIEWEDEEEADGGFVVVKTTAVSSISPNPIRTSPSTKNPIETTTFPQFLTTTVLFDDFDPSSTVPVEHFEWIDEIPRSSTIAGGMAVAQDDSELNWWDLNDSFTQSLPTRSSSESTIPSTTTVMNEDEGWILFSTTPVPSVTRFEHLSAAENDDAASISFENESDFDMNEHFLSSSTPSNSLFNPNQSFVPYYFQDYKDKDKDERNELLNLLKPFSTLAMPPFSWMLNQANKTRASSATSTTTKKSILINRKMRSNSTNLCHGKKCQHGGRLNADCSCICLPAFSGDFCQIVKCEREPAHICDDLVDRECKSDYVRYLCPKHCQTNLCSSSRRL